MRDTLPHETPRRIVRSLRVDQAQVHKDTSLLEVVDATHWVNVCKFQYHYNNSSSLRSSDFPSFRTKRLHEFNVFSDCISPGIFRVAVRLLPQLQLQFVNIVHGPSLLGFGLLLVHIK